mmetsp:Transcript_13611/g.20262  ORF Transcript_13611/g.20262 Transcript_13611/m.20262 type:complete len:243 (+) Transcript_13611:108-836(+)
MVFPAQARECGCFMFNHIVPDFSLFFIASIDFIVCANFALARLALCLALFFLSEAMEIKPSSRFCLCNFSVDSIFPLMCSIKSSVVIECSCNVFATESVFRPCLSVFVGSLIDFLISDGPMPITLSLQTVSTSAEIFVSKFKTSSSVKDSSIGSQFMLEVFFSLVSITSSLQIALTSAEIAATKSITFLSFRVSSSSLFLSVISLILSIVALLVAISSALLPLLFVIFSSPSECPSFEIDCG